MQVLLKKTKPFYTNFNLFGAVSIANPDNIIVDENHNSIFLANIVEKYYQTADKNLYLSSSWFLAIAHDTSSFHVLYSMSNTRERIHKGKR